MAIEKVNKLAGQQLKEVLHIWLTVNQEVHDFIPGDYWNKNLDYTKEALPTAEVFLWKEENVICGFIGLTGDDVAGIFVLPNYRRQGIGDKLLNQAKITHHQLSLHVYEKNKGAVEFYERQGFIVTAKTQDEIHEEWEYELKWRQKER